MSLNAGLWKGFSHFLFVMITTDPFSQLLFYPGAKLDTLIMLIVTSAVIPIFKRLNLSPILGFLMMGTVLGQCDATFDLFMFM